MLFMHLLSGMIFPAHTCGEQNISHTFAYIFLKVSHIIMIAVVDVVVVVDVVESNQGTK